MKVPFVDLKAQYAQIKKEILTELENVCQNTAFVLGPFVKNFERAFAKFIGVKHTIGVNSGTSADQLALQSIIKPGDEIITAPNTFIATTEAITSAGGTIKFVDIDERNFNLDPAKLTEAITPRTRAIMPVHLYGQPADMDPIMEIAREHKLLVIEDAAQAHGAKYLGRQIGESAPGKSGDEKKWRNCGSIGHAGAFSFYPGKNLGAYGEAGAVTTNSDEIAEYVRMYRDHGSKEKYVHEFEGHNMRMEGFQGAVLNIKLKYLEKWTNARRENAQYYNQLLRDIPGVQTPEEMPYARHVYHLYVIRVNDRQGMQKFLSENGIGCGFHYKYPLHLQKAYSHLGYKKGDFPVTEKVMQEIISLPMYPELSQTQMEYVAEKVKQFLGKQGGRKA